MRAPASAWGRGPAASGLPDVVPERGQALARALHGHARQRRARAGCARRACRPAWPTSGRTRCTAPTRGAPRRARPRRAPAAARRAAPGPASMRSSSSRTRSADSSAMRGAAAAHELARARHRAAARRGCSARRRAGCAADRRGRPSRAPRAGRRARRSSRPPNGSIHSPRAHVPRHRVDREVAALEVVAHRQLGVGLDAEVGVRVARVARLARRDRRLAPRRDDLDALARAPRRPEAHAHEAPGDAQLVRLAVARGRATSSSSTSCPRTRKSTSLGSRPSSSSRSEPPTSYSSRNGSSAMRRRSSSGIGYSTVTVFARFRGWSIGRPRRRAMR